MAPTSESSTLVAEQSVHQRYAAAAARREESLCCPIEYDPALLDAVPDEIVERDYGCGDPTPHIRAGDVVLDLGSGGGKVCYIAAQIVGPSGRVIGVDCNTEMLDLARRHLDAVAARLGYSNVEFRRGLIQDLGLDLDRLEGELAGRPVGDASGWLRLRQLEERLRRDHPLVADESVDCIVSNCVLNLVRQEDRTRLFSEMYRVLRRGGRVAISDVVSDEHVPEELQRDGDLFSGCISGAFREDEFLRALEDAGFHGIEIANRQSEPWRTVAGIEFRSVTVTGRKGKEGPCLERNQAVVYRGPFRRVLDDDGHTFVRGQRTAVCDKTFHLLQEEPYADAFVPVEPRVSIPRDEAEPFDCGRARVRDPRETKGREFHPTTGNDSSCGGSDRGCC